ncbi:hypothetical protein BBP40_005730 [Aspergillus hancockii]|nr:hypothetical protein BBP40_005730 [Aspergillus hancockii]
MPQEPAAPPPPGVIPDFSNPSGGIHPWLLVTPSICLPVVTCVVAMRLYVKLFMRHEFYLEDYASSCIVDYTDLDPRNDVVFTADRVYVSEKSVSVQPKLTLVPSAAYGGGGYHQWDIAQDDIISYIINVLYSPLIFTVKLSILFMLARFFAPYQLWVTLIYVLCAVLAAYTIAATVVKTRICMPISAFWRGLEAANGTCLNVLKVFLSDTIFSVITDLTILALPMALIPVLHLTPLKKLRVIAVLAAGGLACVVTIVRLVWVILYQNSTDRTWTTKRTDLVTCAEIALGIICACLPAVNFLVTQSSPCTHLHLASSTPYETREGA